MNYTIDIIDTQDDSLVMSVEKAVARSLILDWKGGDRKDELFLLGSSLEFTMLGRDCADAQYGDLFTGDETRFKVVLSDENTTIWSGFLLPDAYSEPYHDSPIPVKFQATDGLGRLKGKYLSDDFYKEEKSVIEVFAACLKLTGLNLNFRFAPAIENSEQKDYRYIYIDTSDFKQNDKKEDAYKILDDLLQSMVCTLYQADDYYNIEGFNIRNFRVYKTKVYAPNGELIEEQEVTRLRKAITGLATPNIGIQPPYGTISVSHKREPVSFPSTLHTEENDGWVIQQGATGTGIYASDWYGYNGAEAETTDDLTVKLANRPGSSDNGYITLKKKPYVKQGQKFKLDMNFEIEIIGTLEQSVKEGLIHENPFLMDIRIVREVDGVAYPAAQMRNYFPEGGGSGQYFSLGFENSLESEKSLQFIAGVSGILEVRIFYPGSYETEDGRNYYTNLLINNFELEEIGFEENYVAEIKSEKEYTLKKEVDLVYADDVDDYSRSFRLQKLRTYGDFHTIEIPIIRRQVKDGIEYAFVSLKDANLIADNMTEAKKDQIEEVIYNYNNSQWHALKLKNNAFPDDIVTVTVQDLNGITENRDYWQQWSDSIYRIERKRYPDVVANIYSLMFDKPIFKNDLPVKNNIKINDFIDFNFTGNKQFMLSNCRWDIDNGTTDFIGVQAYYGVEAGVNLPPVVEIGPDIFIDQNAVHVLLEAEAYDPDGFIVSYEWEEVTDNGVTFNNKNRATTSAFFLNDFSTFKVTVTDNDGATATDTVNVYRTQTVGVDKELIDSTNEADHGQIFSIEHKLIIDPEIKEGSEMNIQGSLDLTLGGYSTGEIRVFHNGVEEQASNDVKAPSEDQSFEVYEPVRFSLNYTPGDDIRFTMQGIANDSGSYVKTAWSIDFCEFMTGTGEIEGLPEGYTVEHDRR